MSNQQLTKKYYPITLYLSMFVLVAIIPASITTYLSIRNADKIQLQADQETIRRAHLELSKDIRHLAHELVDIVSNLAEWDETRTLFVDATYYNYWRDTRVKKTAQYKGLVDAVDLYSDKGKALTADFILAPVIDLDAVNKPIITKTGEHVYLTYYHPIYQATSQNNSIMGYIGARMNLDLVADQYLDSDHTYINSIRWQVPENSIMSIDKAIAQAELGVKYLPEIRAFADIIRKGFTEYLIYTITLVVLLIVLLSLSIGRPLERLARYLHEIYSGTTNKIPVDFHGVIRIRELEVVRQAINDFKLRFQSAAETLEEKNEELMRLTYHDPLTGCYNRRAFESRMEHALERAVVENTQHALCYIDLDQFKVINDTCGHLAGDELLKQIAVLLQSEIRTADMMARLGGDEFGVLLEGCELQQAERIANAMRQKVKSNGFSWQDKPFDISISVGLVAITSESSSLSEIWKNADAACYIAKDSGRNRIQIYQEHDKELAQRHGEMQWVSRLKQALDEDRFELYCQLIKPVDKRDPHIHYEVLLRMRDSNNDLIPPMAFIPAAERYNMMSEIDAWVITHALYSIKNIPSNSKDRITLAINLSGQSIGNSDVLDIIKNAITANDIDPSQLCFEITETAAMTNLTAAIHFIKSLRSIGCKFSLDDFGSGLSSFGYLSNLEVDYIKIDGEFIKSIEVNPLSYTIVNAINQIGHVLGIKTIAEFVENETIINCLARIGIDYIQGYGVHKPEPLRQLLRENSVVNG